MKKNRGDKPIEVIIHIYMELSQGNSLCSYFYLKQAKNIISSFFFSSTESENRRTDERVVINERGKVKGKGGRRVNTVQNTCTQTIPVMGKRDGGGGEFKYDIFDTL
jgi:hypothetical protein